jgi:hypothetical protein
MKPLNIKEDVFKNFKEKCFNCRTCKYLEILDDNTGYYDMLICGIGTHHCNNTTDDMGCPDWERVENENKN